MEQDQNYFKNSPLYGIPVYRLLMLPNSFLRKNNPEITLEKLISELPKTVDIDHIKELSFRHSEEREKYYDNYLLIESKKFCRFIVQELKLNTEVYDKIISENNFQRQVEIIKMYRLEFLKYLLSRHINEYGLKMGRVLELIKSKNSETEVLSIVKSHSILKKLTSILSKEIQRLY